MRTYKCKKCSKEKLYKDFSEHKQCKLGIDTSACKPCKKSAFDWKKVSTEKKILNRTKTRSKERNLEFDLELEDIVLPEKCPVFKKDFIYGDTNWTYSIDRIDNSKGYIKDNIQIISNRANRLKGDFTIEELKLIVEFLENNKVTTL